jgi:hypothetical protein
MKWLTVTPVHLQALFHGYNVLLSELLQRPASDPNP